MSQKSILLVVLGLLAGCTELPIPRPDAIVTVATMENPSLVALRAPAFDIPPSDYAGEYVLGWHCTRWPDTFRYQHIRTASRRSRLEPIIADALRDAGFQITNDPENLFRQEERDDEGTFFTAPDDDGDTLPEDGRRFEIGARVTEIRFDACPRVDPWSGAEGGTAGNLTIRVDWQVYDHQRDRLALRQEHPGGAILDLPDEESVPLLIETAFSVSTNRFLADPAVRTLLSTP